MQEEVKKAYALAQVLNDQGHNVVVWTKSKEEIIRLTKVVAKNDFEYAQKNKTKTYADLFGAEYASGIAMGAAAEHPPTPEFDESTVDTSWYVVRRSLACFQNNAF